MQLFVDAYICICIYKFIYAFNASIHPARHSWSHSFIRVVGFWCFCYVFTYVVYDVRSFAMGLLSFRHHANLCIVAFMRVCIYLFIYLYIDWYICWVMWLCVCVCVCLWVWCVVCLVVLFVLFVFLFYLFIYWLLYLVMCLCICIYVIIYVLLHLRMLFHVIHWFICCIMSVYASMHVFM